MAASKGEALEVLVDAGAASQWAALPGASVQGKLAAAKDSNRVVIFGRSTCPFCIEVSRTLAEMGVPYTYFRLDELEDGSAVLEELKHSSGGQRTVPYVFIQGQLVGGCDSTKALIASGEFDRLVGTGGGEGRGKGAAPVPTAGVDDDAPQITGALLEFPNTVDGRIIRTVALEVFVITLLIAIFSHWEDRQWRWVSVGVLVDFCLRFYAGAGISPLGSLAQLAWALGDLLLPKLGVEIGPVWGAGPPKQFAVGVGILFSCIIVVMQFTQQWQAATAFAAALCFFAALEGFINFCAGCWVFGHAIRLNLIPDSIYSIHINTLPETKYTWHEWTKTVNPPKPQPQRKTFQTHPKPTKIDLRYKTGKSDDWEREDFDIIKHAKIGFFSSVVGVVAIPAMFRFMSMSPRFATDNLVWQILTVLSLVYTAIFLIPYCLKLAMYPRKVWKEWMHPVMSNAFSVPFMCLVVFAFLADHYSNTFAKVLFWAGAGPMMALSLIIVGEWLARLRHEGHVNGSMQMTPVGNYIVAVVGPMLDRSYTSVCYMWFGFATIMYITLFVFTFQRTVLGHNSDPRGRMFAAIWVAAPAVAAIAWTVLQGTPGFQMDPFAQTLFYIAVTMGLLLVWMAWRRFLWTDKFFMQMWAFGFPTAALAWAGVLYDATIHTALSKVLAVCLVSLACIFATVLTLRTLAGIARLKVFIPEHRWGPMSHLPLSHDAMRELLDQLQAAAAGLAADPGNGRLASRVQGLWRAFTSINTNYIKLKNDICFPQVGAFFPGQPNHCIAQNNRMLEMQAGIDAALAGLGAPGAGASPENGVTEAGKGSIDAYPGATVAEKISAAITQNKLVVFGRSTCPFCIEVTRTLGDDLGLAFPYFKLDTLPQGADVLEELKRSTGQRTVPFVYANGRLLGGCDATKALIASGEFDRVLGGGGDSGGGKAATGAPGAAALQSQLDGFAGFARQAFLDVEDHIRPVPRRYMPLPVQKKIMNDCWDHMRPEDWFLVLPLVVQHLPTQAQRLTYIRAFLWALPERCQQIGTMVALGVDPVTWYRVRHALPDIVPRGEYNWRHY